MIKRRVIKWIYIPFAVYGKLPRQWLFYCDVSENNIKKWCKLPLFYGHSNPIIFCLLEIALMHYIVIWTIWGLREWNECYTILKFLNTCLYVPTTRVHSCIVRSSDFASTQSRFKWQRVAWFNVKLYSGLKF